MHVTVGTRRICSLTIVRFITEYWLLKEFTEIRGERLYTFWHVIRIFLLPLALFRAREKAHIYHVMREGLCNYVY